MRRPPLDMLGCPESPWAIRKTWAEALNTTTAPLGKQQVAAVLSVAAQSRTTLPRAIQQRPQDDLGIRWWLHPNHAMSGVGPGNP